MSRPDWHKIRDRSEGWKAFKNGKIKSTPWATDEGEMAKKTVLRRLLKTQPQSPEELRQVLAQEDETEFVEERVAPVSPIRERLAGAIGQGDGMQHDVGDDVEAALKAARAVTMIDDEQEPAPQPHHAVAVGSGRPPSPVSQPSAATTSESEPDSSAARDEGKESPPKQSVTDSVRGSRDAQGNGPPSASHIPELAAAFEAGREARRKNFKKRAVPPEYRERGRSAEAAAWMQGWEAEDGAKSGGA
jgi:recombination protein RecT